MTENSVAGNRKVGYLMLELLHKNVKDIDVALATILDVLLFVADQTDVSIEMFYLMLNHAKENYRITRGETIQ